MTISKRDLLRSMAGAMAVPLLVSEAESTERATQKPTHDMSSMPKEWQGSEQIAMLMYPGFTALDLVGPQYMFANLMGATVHLVAASGNPVMSDTKLAIEPSVSFADCPRDLDIIFVPGGSSGTLAAMKDKALMDFVADRGSRAKYIASVCTGSLILGHAGLLKNYQATSHWITRDLLPLFGATPVNKRYVIDRNRITGAGVTAGVDFGLAITEILRGRDYAEAVQLLAEYAPQPPFAAGTPDQASKKTTTMLRDMFAGFQDEVRQIAKASQ